MERALNAGCTPVSVLLERKHIEGEARDILARCGDIPVYTADFDILTKLTGFALTRGVLCAMRRPALPAAENVCLGARRIAVLENIMNPTNVGAIFRSAAALGIDAVLLTPDCSNPLYRRAIRVSMGTVFQIPWTWLPAEPKQPSPSYVSFLKKLGFQTAALALTDNSISLADRRLAATERLAIILGSEGDGLCAATLSGCDYTIRIPMMHGVDSLNVAAASAVAFWELCKYPE